jgi:cob(I)alamin adenosyltransferase
VRKDKTRIIQVYYGPGKGKTTAAIGQALRAAGNGFSVSFVSFMKNLLSGEFISLQTIPNINIWTFGTGKFVKNHELTSKDIDMAAQGISKSRDLIIGGNIDLLILDEIGHILEFEIIKKETLLELFDLGDNWLDMVLTGRTFPDYILEKADLVTYMDSIKHPFSSGISARRGIEF